MGEWGRGGRSINLKRGQRERKKKNNVWEGQAYFWGRLCLNQDSKAAAGAAWPQECAPVVCSRVINQSWWRPRRCSAVPQLTHTQQKRQWWIRQRSDSLGVADSPHQHNKLSHDLISLCSPFSSFATRVCSSFNPHQPLSIKSRPPRPPKCAQTQAWGLICFCSWKFLNPKPFCVNMAGRQKVYKETQFEVTGKYFLFQHQQRFK